MVMPRSRSMSMESSIWSWNSRSVTAPQRISRRSARVLLPWSIWAMIEKLRINDRSVISLYFAPPPLRAGRKALLTTQHGTGGFRHLRHDFVRDGLDLGIGHRALDRLQGDGDRERLLALRHALAGIEVEHPRRRDQRLVGGARGAHQSVRLDARIDQEREVALDRLERREHQLRS